MDFSVALERPTMDVLLFIDSSVSKSMTLMFRWSPCICVGGNMTTGIQMTPSMRRLQFKLDTRVCRFIGTTYIWCTSCGVHVCFNHILHTTTICHESNSIAQSYCLRTLYAVMRGPGIVPFTAMALEQDPAWAEQCHKPWLARHTFCWSWCNICIADDEACVLDGSNSHWYGDQAGPELQCRPPHLNGILGKWARWTFSGVISEPKVVCMFHYELNVSSEWYCIHILSCNHLCIMDIPCIMIGSTPPPQFLDTGISKLDYIHHSFIDWILVWKGTVLCSVPGTKSCLTITQKWPRYIDLKRSFHPFSIEVSGDLRHTILHDLHILLMIQRPEIYLLFKNLWEGVTTILKEEVTL